MDGILAGAAALTGRLLLSSIFLLSGFRKITDWAGTSKMMEGAGLPGVPALLTVAVAAEILGGIALLVGWKARWGALSLIAFLVPTTLVFHAFWSVPAEQYQMQMGHFLSNLAILGGLLYVAAAGAGRYSVDAHAKK